MPSHICQPSQTHANRLEFKARQNSQDEGFCFLPEAVTGSVASPDAERFFAFRAKLTWKLTVLFLASHTHQ